LSNRHQRRADIARGRQARIAQFRHQAAGAGYETSLRAVGEHRPQDGRAIADWFFREPVAKPFCFSCRASFSTARRPGGFLCAVSIRSPKAGTAVAAICQPCWAKDPAEIEKAALDALRRNLGARGFAD
jgi:hypothetical protein